LVALEVFQSRNPKLVETLTSMAFSRACISLTRLVATALEARKNSSIRVQPRRSKPTKSQEVSEVAQSAALASTRRSTSSATASELRSDGTGSADILPSVKF